MVIYILSAVMYHRNIVLCIHLPVLNQLDLNIHSGKKLIIVPVILGMNMMMILIPVTQNGAWNNYFEINQDLLQYG